ncbi:hypothetical protein [Nostoc sp. MG11]|uniref:hypothetical protein n=1 Tax=Nostoc sp. MG11 TaxID=2721166 RepID=UPI0018688C15|nr:hypothetical protein [Nostoc sp. MG11]
MSKIKVLVITFLANPTCTNWIQGLKSLGLNVAVLDWKQSAATQSEIENWGFKENEIPIFNFWDDFSTEKQQKVENFLGGTPDILFSWEGALILKPLQMVKTIYPMAKIVHCVNTYPNAVNKLTEIRMNWRYRNVNSLIDSYIFYSHTQRNMFVKNIPNTENKPYLVMVEPFFEKAYSSNTNIKSNNIPQLHRFDDNPHVVFTGRASELWHKNFYLGFKVHSCRDALGSFFQELAKQGIHIFLPSQADTKNIPNLHLYPDFSNDEIFEGQFAEYISQFDAHLVMYNEYNSTMRNWVTSGLSTRFASSLTSTTPLAVTKTSKFVEEHWKDKPFGFTFSDVEDLAKSLRNKQMLASLRLNMEKVHTSYSFESQSKNVTQFLNEVLKKPKILN